MPKYRNVTDRTLSVQTETGWKDIKPDEVLAVTEAFAKDRYFQTGATGEEALWAPVDKAPTKSPTTK